MIAFAPIAIGLGGCGTGQNAASQVLKSPELPTDTQTKCRVAKSQSEPLIVEWPDAARARLESMTKKGLVAVRYEGCELTVLPRCMVKIKDGYGYTPVTRRVNKVTIRDADELYMKLPAGAVHLEGKLKTAGQLNVQMTTVGRWESGTRNVFRDDLDGECDNATHIIHALTVGAFTFSAGSDAEVGGSGGVGNVGGGAKSTAARETIARDGDEAACGTSSNTNTAPPEGCGGPFQIEVMPLAKGSKPIATPVPVPVPAPAPTPAPNPNPLPDPVAESPTTKPAAKPGSKPPKCKKGERVEDGVCVKLTAKKPPTKPAAIAAVVTCAGGQHSLNGRCVDDDPPPAPDPQPQPKPKPEPPPTLSCAHGMHLEHESCVADPVPETHTPTNPQLYTGGTVEDQERPNPWRTVFAYSAVGFGIVAGAAGYAAIGNASAAKDLCNETARTCGGDYDSLRSTAITAGIIADVSLALTGLSLLGFFLVPAKLKVSLAPTTNAVFAGAGGQFR